MTENGSRHYEIYILDPGSESYYFGAVGRPE